MASHISVKLGMIQQQMIWSATPGTQLLVISLVTVIVISLWKWTISHLSRKTRDSLSAGNHAFKNKLTVIVTTSASEHNPSTVGIESVFASFSIVPDLLECRKIIVFDWPEVDKGSLTCHLGRISREGLAKYRKYIECVQSFCAAGVSMWAHTTCIVLKHRHGFALAVGAALEQVKTEFVLVVQHDRCFVGPAPLRQVVEVMEHHPEEISYIGFPVNNRSTYREADAIAACHKGFRVNSRVIDGLCLFPLLLWYDSTHVARVDKYQNMILPRMEIGDFFEEKFGREMVKDIVSNGISAHQKYGSFLLLDRMRPRGYLVGHLEVLRSKEDRNLRRDYGHAELSRICERMHSTLNNLQILDKVRQKHPRSAGLPDMYKLGQRIGLLKRLADIGALSPSLNPKLEEMDSLVASCGITVPSWHDLVIC